VLSRVPNAGQQYRHDLANSFDLGIHSVVIKALSAISKGVRTKLRRYPMPTRICAELHAIGTQEGVEIDVPRERGQVMTFFGTEEASVDVRVLPFEIVNGREAASVQETSLDSAFERYMNQITCACGREGGRRCTRCARFREDTLSRMEVPLSREAEATQSESWIDHNVRAGAGRGGTQSSVWVGPR
jgi:hypothetical protein